MSNFKLLVDGEEVLKILTDKKAGYGKLSRDLFIAVLEDKILDYPYEERIRGEWLDFYGNFETAECSLCGEQFEVNFDGEANGALFAGFKKEYSYCPHCGAKMDGKDGE